MNKRLLLLIISQLWLFGICSQVAYAGEARAEECVPVKVYLDKRCGDNSIHVNEWVELTRDQCAKLTIYSRSRWNASNLKLDSKGKYRFTITHAENWQDGSIQCNQFGWRAVASGPKAAADNVTSVEMASWKRALISFFAYFRRAPDLPWFRLIGVVADKGHGAEQFDLAPDKSEVTGRGGQLCSYANDHSWFYWNNQGSLELMVERIQ